MKSVSMPMMPWFHRDFLAATQSWKPLERFAYFMLLGAQWETGPLPADIKRLATVVGVPASEFKLLWKTVAEKFETSATGLINERLEQHRQKALELQASRQRGAAKTNARHDSQLIPFPPGGSRDER